MRYDHLTEPFYRSLPIFVVNFAGKNLADPYSPRLMARAVRRGKVMPAIRFRLPILALCIVVLLPTTVPLASAHAFRVLHTFSGPDGAFPEGTLVRDSAGNLYGTTAFGGTRTCGVQQRCGTAFMRPAELFLRSHHESLCANI